MIGGNLQRMLDSAAAVLAALVLVAGAPVEIADVYTVKVRRTRDGARTAKAIHLALVGGELRWFSNC
jgi:hypothetical protein